MDSKRQREIECMVNAAVDAVVERGYITYNSSRNEVRDNADEILDFMEEELEGAEYDFAETYLLSQF